MKIRPSLIWCIILGIHFIGYPMNFSHNSYPSGNKEYLLDDDSATDRINSEEISEQKHPGLLPALQSFIYFLGREYLSYKLEFVFQYLDNKIASHAKSHIEKTWITYKGLGEPQQGKTNQIFHNHYHECNLCQGVARLIKIGQDETGNNMERLQIQINYINHTTQKAITNLESQMNQHLQEIDRRFISMEHEVQLVKDKVRDNSVKIDGFESGLRDISIRTTIIEENIFKYAMPRVAILRSVLYNEKIFFDFKNNYRDLNIEIFGGIQQQKLSIVLITEREVRLAEELSARYNLPLVKYKTTGLHGFEHFDIILIL